MGLFQYFDKTYISTDMKLMKPQKEICIKVLNELNILLNESVFIDDKVKYVDAAKNVGINELLFENFNKLKKDLIKLNIKIH